MAGNGNGEFQLPVRTYSGSKSQSVAIGEFNGDGRTDLAIADEDANKAIILLGAQIAMTPGGTPQSTIAGTAFAAPLTATVTDTTGNPVSGVPVIFSVPSSGASASLAAAMVLTDANGIAGVTATANGTLGGYVVTAAAVSVTATFNLSNVLGQPASLTAANTPQFTPIGAVFPKPLQATMIVVSEFSITAPPVERSTRAIDPGPSSR